MGSAFKNQYYPFNVHKNRLFPLKTDFTPKWIIKLNNKSIINIMSMKLFEPRQIPTEGYILKNWNTSGYRATAIAYLDREDLYTIENIDGYWYSVTQLKNARIM